MGDNESRLKDYKEGLNPLYERADKLVEMINSQDPGVALVNWLEWTNNYDLLIIKYIYGRIDVDGMLDIVTDLILKEYSRLISEGKIKPLSLREDELTLLRAMRSSLDNLAGHRRVVLKARREEEENRLARLRQATLDARRKEEEARQRYYVELLGRKQEVAEHVTNVPMHHAPDGEPCVDDFRAKVAAEVEDLRKENVSLRSRLGEKEEELNRLKDENARLLLQIKDGTDSSNPRILELEEELEAYEAKGKGKCLTAGPAAALFLAVAQMTDPDTFTKEKLAVAISKVFGFKVSENGQGYVRNRLMYNSLPGKNGKVNPDAITPKHRDVVARMVEEAMPNLAARIRKG
jgi:hypothetical protein